MSEKFNFWWMKELGDRVPQERPLPLLKHISRYIRQHPPAKPIRATVPFTRLQGGVFCYLVASPLGLGVVLYDHTGRERGRELVEDFFERFSSQSGKTRLARRALENFHELLARYVF